MTSRDPAAGHRPEGTAALPRIEAGLTDGLVEELSKRLGEPDWMLRSRRKALEAFGRTPVPSWADFLGRVDYPSVIASATRSAKVAASGAGLAALEESEAAYRFVRRELESQGVVFLRTDDALRKHPGMFRDVFGTVVPVDANPFASLNAALWSGGSFVYVPSGVAVAVPLQAEMREDYETVEPFERTVIVADRGAEVTYIEGCTAPVYTADRLHVSAIEVIAQPGSRVRYIALQNFSKEIDNLVTKRAIVRAGASLEWVDANLGSRRTWKAPEADLVGAEARAEILGLAFAGPAQIQDVGARVRHRGEGTRSRIVLRSIAQRGGRVVLRPEVEASEAVTGAASEVGWSALLLDSDSETETVPSVDVSSASAEFVQEGQLRTLGDKTLLPLTSRGLPREEAIRKVVMGLADEVTKRIPFEYALEVNRLLELELGGAVG